MNLNKILLSALLSTTLIAPAMSMEEVVPQPHVPGHNAPQQPVNVQSADGTLVDLRNFLNNNGTVLIRGNLIGDCFYGHLPKEIATFVNLETICFPSHCFSGPLPKELGDLSKLKKIELSGNKLSRNIPKESLRSKFLKEVILSHNEFTGFDGTEMTNENARISIHNNPFITFITNPDIVYRLSMPCYNHLKLDIHIHFDGQLIEDEVGLMNLRDCLQPNVKAFFCKKEIPLCIGFYEGRDAQNPHPISVYLKEEFGLTLKTVVVKDLESNLTVTGISEPIKAQKFIDALNTVMETPASPFGSKTKGAR